MVKIKVTIGDKVIEVETGILQYKSEIIEILTTIALQFGATPIK